MAIVVSDTSPIRALDHLGLVGLLRDLHGDVLIPPAVGAELRAPRPGMVVIDVAAFPFIRVQAPLDRTRIATLRGSLDLGESEALALALEVGSGVILIDEAAGRAVARRLGLIPTGALGTLVGAKARGLIGAIAPMIERLEIEIRFFVSPSVRDEVLRAAGEIP